MSTTKIVSVLITGANAGIGKELARQLSTRAEITRVYLGVRNRERGRAAVNELQADTGRRIFELVMIDVSSLDSVRGAVASLPGPIDAVVMNAGGRGGKQPAVLTPDGVTSIFAVNVLGHAALLDGLIEAQKLREVAVLVGSEAARGIPKLQIPRPALANSSADELASIIDGSYYCKRFDGAVAYAHVKYLGALWMASMARVHPDLRFVTISPGGTRGTGVATDFPPIMRFIYNRIMMGAIAKKITHTVDVGAARIAAAVEDRTYASGTFYGSAADTLTGPVLDQATIFRDIANQQFQDSANEAVHRFLSPSDNESLGTAARL
jgi:NAD(P)-dependent dehydrogenase (short-subunit alcohol dehydrogenase family)